MKITNRTPLNWRALQTEVTKILMECGFKTELEKKIVTVRGNVEVDVFSEKSAGINTKILCECKFWESNVPQNVVHSLRTIVSDSGASHGLIISKNGFQRGAFKAIENSNISLLTFDEFQDKFLMDWLESIITRNFELGQELLPFTQYNYIETYEEQELNILSEEKRNEFYKIKKECDENNVDFLTFKEHYFELPKSTVSKIEVDKRIIQYEKRLPLEIKCYSDYFNYIYDYGDQTLKKFDNLFKKKLRRNLYG